MKPGDIVYYIYTYRFSMWGEGKFIKTQVVNGETKYLVEDTDGRSRLEDQVFKTEEEVRADIQVYWDGYFKDKFYPKVKQ